MGFDTRLYRLLHQGTPGDVEFYLTRCAGAERVLELGCGDGRIAIPLARAGLSVVGLELDAGMLDAARAAREAAGVADRLTLVQGDMADPPVDGPFDRVIVPYTALYCLTPADCHRCLVAARARLAPGGLLIFDAYPGDDLYAMGVFADDESTWIDGLRDGDEVIEVFERDAHRPGRIEVTYIHQLARPGAMPTRVSYTLTHHYLRRHEVAPVLAAAGLRLVGLYGDFEGGRCEEGSERMVVIAEPAEETTR